ncbi:MAG: site-2 protease family protein, partial [Thermoplasmataceae archaeon]
SPNSIYSSIGITGMELTSIGNYSGNSLVNLPYNSFLAPGSIQNASFFDGSSTVVKSIPVGVTIYGTISGYPAASSNLQPSSIITAVDNKTVYNLNSLTGTFQNVTPGKNVYISTVLYRATGSPIYNNTTVGTVSEYSYYNSVDPSAATSSMKNVAFVGIEIIYSGMSLNSLSALKNLVSGSLTYQIPWYGFLETLSLPFSGLSPIPASLAHMYSTPFSGTVFYALFNMLYWLFWVNILLAITNALPIVITDGHQFFRESLTILSRRKRFAFLKEKKIFDAIIFGINLLVLLLFIIEFLAIKVY